MLLRIFTIQDVKAGAYLPPWFLPETAMAQRTFGDCCNDKEHQFGIHPDDYTLFAVGTFDNETGMILSSNPESLGNGLEYVVEQAQSKSILKK